jgi:Fe-S cluster assembly protein SufD
MSQWLNRVIDEAQGINDYLLPIRQEALTELKEQGWPGPRNESWRFTRLTSLRDREIDPSKEGQGYAIPEVPGLDPIDLVFVDGQLTTDLDALTLPEGLKLTSLEVADPELQQKISGLFAQVKPQRHLFGLVNDVLCQQGIYLEVAEGVTIERPIRVLNFATRDVDGHTRLLVNLEANSRLTLIEQGSGDQTSLTTSFSEYQLGAQAELEHYRFALFTDGAKQVGGSHFKLGTEARLNSTFVGYGSELSRLDVDITHAGEHAKAQMNAIYLVAEAELFDLHSTIEHAVPNGTTTENARGIVGERAKAVFNGRIHIHRDAQKTLAELNNRNLLLSNTSQIFTKPELEIYADDVQCAHGATVAEIEEKALYYLLTRGIDRSKALVMLNFGFIQELVNAVPNESLRDWLMPILSERFARMEVK